MSYRVNDKLQFPVPYTLEMSGDGSFRAIWQPAVPTVGFPESITATSKSNGIHALERLHEQLVNAGLLTA